MRILKNKKFYEKNPNLLILGGAEPLSLLWENFLFKTFLRFTKCKVFGRTNELQSPY